MNILFFLLKTFNSLIPKSNNKIIFISRPDFADNTKHMYSYMQKKSPQKQLSWLIYDKEIYDILMHNGHKNIFYLKSISGMWEYLRSKTIITSSSSLWQIKSPIQKQFDLWHGIPLKNILCMGETGTQIKRQAGNITMRFATSNLEKAQLAASFDFNAMKIIVTGQPRTDALFNEKNNLSELLGEDLNKYAKIIFYMPTYRGGFSDKDEGTAFSVDNIFRMNNYNHHEFIHYLEEKNILFLLKLHPYEEKLYNNISLNTNIKWITHTLLIENNLDVHELLNQVDILMTDYSSIYFDFLLLDRKIIFIPSDLDKYEANRGFELEPYDFWTPGEKVFDQHTLQTEINKEDSKCEQQSRKIIRDIMFKDQDNLSSQRVFKHIKKSFD